MKTYVCEQGFYNPENSVPAALMMIDMNGQDIVAWMINTSSLI